ASAAVRLVHCFFPSSGDPRALHSFPTRRSSDLVTLGADMTPEQVIKARQSNLKDLGGAFKAVRDQLKLSQPNIAEIKQAAQQIRSEEHTSELQSLTNLVCRLLLEKKTNRK